MRLATRTSDLIDFGKHQDGREFGVGVLGDGRVVEEHTHVRAQGRLEVDEGFFDQHLCGGTGARLAVVIEEEG